MSEKGKNRKPLLIGVIAAVVILAALLAVLLMQCGGGGNVTPPASQTTTAPTEPVVIGDGRLYWNVDRALYDGMSEGGMSSRSAGSDGYFHIRFFVDGEMVELLAEDRRTVNNIEARDLMGFVLEGNVIKEVIPIEDMNHVQKVGWKFYVQSTGGTLIKVNSSDKFNGMEMILDTKDGGKVYDMTGTFGEIGSESEAVMNDRVMGVADLDGKLLAVYIYDRSNMVIEFDAHCQHCDKTVTWIEWDKDNTLPVAEGHYKLTKDIQLKAQQSIGADAKICLDLNGKTVNGAEGKRVYSLHNMNCELAIMDTSENKDGRLVAHGESASQGLVVWVRYGVFYLYGGILDATDATTTNLGGANVYVAQDRFFYMYGGEVVGGTAKYKLNESSGQYANGTGGAIYIRGGKFVMNDGVIRDGVAQSVATWADGETVYKRGNGGNLFVSGGVFEMNGGVIEGGKAGTGGNIFLDGTTEFTMNGGQIKNGVLTDPGRNGGNIYINSKVKAVINDGRISGGVSYNASGNIHLAGTLTMNGGVISGGRIIDPETGKNMPTKAHRNMYVGNGAKFYMSGGWIYGGVAAVDSNAEDGKKTTVVLSGVATIADGPEGSPNLTLMAGKEPVKVIVGPMLSFSKIGVTAAGIFSEETDESNLAHFFSDVEGVDVLYTDKRLALGVIACLCGVNSEKAEDHIGECKGEKLLWQPWISTNSLPSAEGNYFLVDDVTLKSQIAVGTMNGDQVVNLNLNGKTVTSEERVLLVYSELNVVDHVGGGRIVGVGRNTGEDHTGVVLLYGGSEMNLYSGTLQLADDHYDISNGGVLSIAEGASFTMYGGVIDGRSADTENTVGLGGAVRLSGSMTVVDGTIYGGKVTNGGAFYIEKKGSLTVQGGTIVGGTAQQQGGSIYITGENAKLTLSGGVLDGGSATEGGVIRLLGKATVNIEGGTVQNGTTTGVGGNISVASGSLTIDGTAQIKDGSAGDVGGNIFLSGGKLHLKGGTVSGGQVKGATDNHSANICVRNAAEAVVSGGTVKGGFLVYNTNKENAVKITLSGSPVITCEETYGLRLFNLGEGTVVPVIEVSGKLEDGASVTVNTLGVITGETTEENVDNFHSTLDYVDVVYYDKSIALGRLSCLCGEQDCIGECDGTGLLWQPWTSKDSLPTVAGNYYLVNDVTKSGQMYIGDAESGQAVNLNLNGKSITGAQRAFAVNGLVNIVDHVGGSQIVGAGPKSGTDHTGVVVVNAGGELNLYSGTIRLADKHYKLTNGGVVSVVEGAEMTMYGGVIDGRSAETENTVGLGGAVRLSGTMTVVDGTIHGGKAANGGAFYIEKKGSLTVQGGTVYGGTAQQQGGSIYITGENAKLTLSGGVLDGGSATEGGVIRLLGSATVNIEGGTVKNGTTTGAGGNISMASGSLTIDGKTEIKDGSAGTLGGNIFLSGGTLYLKNGTVSGGKAKETTDDHSANICVQNAAAAVVSGGTVKGGFLVYNSTAANAAKITLSGSPVITREETYGLRLYATGGATAAPVIELTEKLGDAKIAINADPGVFTGATVAENKDKFTSNDGTGVGINAADCLYLGWSACLCGAAENVDPATVAHKSWCDKEMRIWQPWDGKSDITAPGSYRLMANAENNKILTIGEENKTMVIDLDLNGKPLTGTGIRVMNVYSTLNVVDHGLNGTMLGVGAADNHSAVAVIFSGGTMNLLDGTLKLSEKHPNLKNGGTVAIAAGGTMNIYEDAVVDASASLNTEASTIENGAAIRVTGTLNLKGGEIKGGKAVSGGAIYVEKTGTVTVEAKTEIYGGAATNGGNICVSGGTVTLKGGSVTGGSTTGLGGNICLTGGTLNLESGTVSGGTVAGSAENASANICVSDADANVSGGIVEGGFLVQNTTADHKAKLTLSGSPVIRRVGGFGLLLDKSGEAEKISVIAVTEALNAAASIAIDNTDCYITGKTVAGNEEYFAVKSGYGVVFAANERLYVGQQACLCGAAVGVDPATVTTHKDWCDHETKGLRTWQPWNGKSSITKSGSYFLTDEAVDPVEQVIKNTSTVTLGKSDNTDLDIDLNLNGQTISAVDTRALYVYARVNIVDHKEGGTVIGTGAEPKEITEPEPSVELDHSAVAVVTGTLNLYDGTLKLAANYNELGDGGTVAVAEGGTMTIYADGVVDATASLADGAAAIQRGAAIRVNGTLNILGGTIKGGKANEGGSILITGAKASLTMKSGTLDGGVATLSGGVIRLLGSATVNIEGGTVQNGTTTGAGGNISMVSGSLNVTGGKILNGTAATDGGSLHVTGGTLNLGGCTIQTGKAARGGILYASAATVTVQNGAIIKDGVATDDDDTVTGDGGNIYITGGASFTMTGGQITGGSAANGGAIRQQGNATVTIEGGTISGGTATGAGGNISMLSGTLTIEGGNVLKGNAANGGNIHISGGTVNLNGGSIEDGTATSAGGNIYISGEETSLTITGGEIKGGRAATNGGSIHQQGNAVVTISGGTVSGGTAGDNGGCISVASGTLSISGNASIEGGTAGNNGGNIFIRAVISTDEDENVTVSDGILNIAGGRISGGKAKAATETDPAKQADNHTANVCVQNATVNVSGGTVEGNFLVMNTSEHKEASITITGNPVINKGEIYGLRLFNNGGERMPLLNLPETLDGSASIAIYNVDCYISGATVAENAERFVPRNGYGVEWDESGLYVGVSACLCGKEEHESWCTHETDGNLIWRSWDGKSNITESGNYYLMANTTSSAISIGSSGNSGIVVNLNLNGHTITGVDTSDRVMNVYGTLNLVDHDPEDGGKLIGVGKVDNHSAVATVRSGAVLNLYDGILELFTSHNNLNNLGGMVTVFDGGTMTIWPDGLVDASASRSSINTIVQGGAIRVLGTLNLKGGKICGGKVTTNGGALYINGGTVNVEADSEISGGQAGENGGNIYMTSGTLNLLGGTVSGGAAGQDGGNIYMTSGTLNLLGGTVSGGMVAGTTANVSANISVYDAAVNISGGTVEGGFLVENSTPDHETRIAISGNPIINRVNGYGLLLGQTDIAEEIPMITLGELTGASIAIDSTGYITGVCETDYSDVFHPAEGNGVEYDDTKCLYVGRAMCLCGASKTGGTHTDWCALEENKTLIWRPWDGNSTITSGNYYLTESITNGETLTINGTVNLDLNGTTYTAKTRAALLTQGDSLRIVDSVGTGTMIGKGAVNSGTGGVFSSNNGKIYLFAGTFKLAEQHNRITDGGVVVVSNPSGELHIYDGVVIDASTATGVVANGGAIRLMKGKIYIHGGTIYGYSGITGFGSAIYVKEGGEVYAYGGSIARGDVYIDDSTLTVDGKPSIEKVTLPKDMKITVEDTLDAENASIGIDMAVPGVFADDVTTDLSGAFVSGTTGYDVFYSVVNENLSLIKTHSHCWCEGAENAPEHSCLDNQKWKPIEKKTSDKKVVNEGGHYYLNWTGRSAQSIEVSTTEDVYICLNGAEIYARSAIVLCEGANVYICDCANGSGMISISGSSAVAAIHLNMGATVNLVNGTVEPVNSTQTLQAVVVNHENAVFNMYGGTITGGSVDGNGDNIHLIAGEVNISGGSVSFSGDEYDILVEGGSFNVSGDTGLNKLYQTGGSVIADGSNNQMIIELFCQGGSMTVTGMGYIETLHVAGGNVSVGGAVQIVTLYLAEGQTVNILEEGLNADIGISMEVPGVIADVSDTLRASFLKRFTSLNEGQTIGLNDGNLVMGAEADHQHCYCINAEVVPEGHVCNTLQTWSTIQLVQNKVTINASGNYYLPGVTAGTITISGQETVVNLCLNGHKLSGQTVIKLEDGAKLVICDCSGDGFITTTKESPIQIDAGETVVLMSGTINGTNGTTASRVSVLINGGAFQMYGGKVSDGCTNISNVSDSTKKEGADKGGNIYITDGAVDIYGGIISGGAYSSADGGNISVQGGTVNIHGGTIQNGKARRGANIGVNGGAVNIYDGLITNGESTNHGGNIIITNGTITMNGGTITAGKAGSTHKGGNVMLLPNAGESAVFVMNDGLITGGLSDGFNAQNGGNVCVNMVSGAVKCAFNMIGGQISGGKASADGGNVYINGAKDEFSVEDGTISGGFAEKLGDDVYVKAGVVTVGSTTRIGEVYLANNRTITVSAEKPLTGDASIGVVTAVAPAVDTPVVIAAGATSAQGFTTTMSGCIVDYVDGNVVLKLAE